MTFEERKDARGYAWNHFMLHADQRMKLFNFFLILSGLILGAFPAVRTMAPGTRLIGFLPMLLVLSAFIFWRLDERTKGLLNIAKDALRFLDTQWGIASEAEGIPHYLRLVERDDYMVKKNKEKWWYRVIPVRYTANFRIVYLMVGSVGVALAVWTWFS